MVSVRDSGVGLPADMLTQAFDLFTQANGSMYRGQGGLGIGLAPVQRLVERHGGTVMARSEGTGKGSEVVVRLSLLVEPTEVAKHTHKTQVFSLKSTHRILIVDDNRDAADSLVELLFPDRCTPID